MKNGEVMKFWNCEAGYNFIKDCLEFKRSILIRLVAEHDPEIESISLNDVLEVARICLTKYAAHCPKR